jgi:hypothetical protein
MLRMLTADTSGIDASITDVFISETRPFLCSLGVGRRAEILSRLLPQQRVHRPQQVRPFMPGEFQFSTSLASDAVIPPLSPLHLFFSRANEPSSFQRMQQGIQRPLIDRKQPFGLVIRVPPNPVTVRFPTLQRRQHGQYGRALLELCQ